MSKCVFGFLVFLNTPELSHAQNLVPNPSFEICDQCDNRGSVEFGFGLRGTNTPPDWRAATQGSSDIRSEEPRSGSKHGGFFGGTKHEYLCNELSQGMDVLHTYELSYFLKGARNANYLIDEIGLALTFDDPSSNIFTALTSVTPQWITPDGEFIASDSFRQEAHSYLACGGEKFITLGRFQELGPGDTLFQTGRRGSPAAYIIVDDVAVVATSEFDFFKTDTLQLCADTTIEADVAVSSDRFDVRVNGTDSDASVIINGAGTYTIEIICQESGWTYRDTMVVNEETIEFDLGADTVLCTGDTLLLRPNVTKPDWTYSWSNGSMDSVNLVTQPGSYSLTITDGCIEATDGINIQLPDNSTSPDEWLPNAFTPNGDQRNDFFRFIEENMGDVTVLQAHTKIFNRWGNLVFESNEVDFAWGDEDHVSEVYLYLVECTYIACDGIERTISLQGDVTLIR